MQRITLWLLLATLALPSSRAQNAPAAVVAAPAPTASAPAASATAATHRAPPPAMLALMRNPAAWDVPAAHIALVNHNAAIDEAWLTTFAAELQRYLRMPVKVTPLAALDATDGLQLANQARAALSPDAKVFVVLTKLAMDPVLASPQKGWSVMKVDWVTSTPADDAKTKERMSKQLYRALGFALGCGLRMEPQAVMRPTLSPADLDTALSNNYHPQNLAVALHMAKMFGVEAVRLKPRAELEALGLLPKLDAEAPNPEKPATEPPAAPKPAVE